MKRYLLTILLFGNSAFLAAAIKTEVVDYRHASAPCEGFLAYDDARQDNRPGVLIVHAWMGLDDYAKKRAAQLAEMGYVAFVADIYGQGVRAKDKAEAEKLSGFYKNDRRLLRGRVGAGFETLKKQKFVNTRKLAAIGYCFGGTAVLELARGGALLNGVISFHGGLDSPTPSDGKNIRTKILAMQGADDPYVSVENMAAFENEMRQAHVDWQLIKYGGAVHSFSDPGAGKDNSKGAAYNETADRRSWEAMKTFFAEIFK